MMCFFTLGCSPGFYLPERLVVVVADAVSAMQEPAPPGHLPKVVPDFPPPTAILEGAAKVPATPLEPILPHEPGSTTPAMDPATQAQHEKDRRAVYKHPLFPLLALLFEKCEMATHSAEIPSSESFNMDIQAFVQHQERDRKPFFSEDPEVDGLMVKAIQVLRIHLLELEKVQELCKDFCQRYIACLKSKMQSENLLRPDYPGLPSSPASCSSSSSSGSSSSASSPVASNGPMQVVATSNGVPLNNLVLQTTAPSGGPLVSGGTTLFQMLQTPQGLVAQPIQLPPHPTSVIHGSTPLSQIGGNPADNRTPAAIKPRTPQPPSGGEEEDGDLLGKKKQKRGILPKHATSIMRSWLFQHIVHPYPTEDEKRQIAAQTNLTLLQVNNWFINARRRILQPMLDATNPDGSPANNNHKAKSKNKNSSSRPAVQRFWPDSLASLQPQSAGTSSGIQQQPPSNSPPPSSPLPSEDKLTSDGSDLSLLSNMSDDDKTNK